MKAKLLVKVFLSILVLLTFNGCSSSDSQDDPSAVNYYVKFKVDGVSVEYYFNGSSSVDDAYGNFNLEDTANGVFAASIAGAEETGNSSVLFMITSTNQIQMNTVYSNYASPSTTQPGFLNFIYSDDTGVTFSTLLEDDLTTIYPSAIANAKIEFTEVTSISTKGTFSGRVYNSNDSYVEITEGTFKVLRTDL